MKKDIFLVFNLTLLLSFSSQASNQGSEKNNQEVSQRSLMRASESETNEPRYTKKDIIHKSRGRLAVPECECKETPEFKAACQILFPTHGERSFERANSFDENNFN